MRPDTIALQRTVLGRSWTMRSVLGRLIAAAAVTLVGCSLDLTNPNSPTPGQALKDPRTATGQMIVGVLATYRDNRANQIRALGSYGRETYYMFLTDGRFITGPYLQWKRNTSFEGGTQWGRYGNYRNAYVAIKAIKAVPTGAPTPTALTAGEKAGALGLLKTFIALDMLHAIEARVEAKRGSLGCGAPCYARALTALDTTWIADLTATNRDNGVYVVYSVAPGDVLNFASFQGDRNYYVHPSIDSIAGVTLDDRYRRKVAIAGSACGTSYTSPQTEVKVTATHRACTYFRNDAPISTIRNEELVLLRAEARWFTGDQAGALTDLAAVRAGSGAPNPGETAVVKVPTPATDDEF